MPVTISPKPPAPAPQPSPAVAEEGKPITIPHVESPAVKTAAAPVVSEGAEFEVLHTIVGVFGPRGKRGSYDAGDRIKASDLGEGANIERLVRLEALKPLADAPASDPAKPKK